MKHDLKFCRTCNARARIIICGRCVVCDEHPDAVPAKREAS